MNSAAKATSSTQTTEELDAIIIGAGFAGLYQLHCLRDKLGLSVKIVEMADGVGGTWYWNRYPGARCDSESHSYCYAFSDDLVQNWEWSERYPQQAEIMEYLNYAADRLDLKGDIQFETKVTAAQYDEATNRWQVTIEGGETLTAKFLIAAVGCLSTANIPQIPGLDSFEGEWYHTGEWPHEGVDFAGKNVGQIGTGSTGIQSAPVIAAEAGHLTVFQRTANYSVPARNVTLTPEFKTYIKENFADIKHIMRHNTGGHCFNIQERKVFDVSDAERLEIFEAAWEKGGLEFRACFEDLVKSKKANDTVVEFLCNKIREVVKDPATADLLATIDHPYGAKRPPIDTNYFETYNRDNVSLVDIKSDRIVEITPTGIRTSKAEYPLDIIVFATGFDAMTGPLLRLNITGSEGLSLATAWKAGPRTYLGLQVAGFPNFFTITGPGSPSVLCNMPVAIEQHVEWITDCIEHMAKNNLERIETSPEAMDGWVAEVNKAANITLLPQVSHSWYLGANVPGKPRVFMPYAGGMAHYRGLCDDVAAKGYEGFELSGS